MSLLEQAKLSEQPPYASWMVQPISENLELVLSSLSSFMASEHSTPFEKQTILTNFIELEGAFSILEINSTSELLSKWIEILETTDENDWSPESLRSELLVKTCFILKDQTLRLQDGQMPPLSPVMGILKELGVPTWTYQQFSPLLSKILPKHQDLKIKLLELEKYFERFIEHKNQSDYDNLKYFVWSVLKAPQTNLEIDFLKKYHLTQYWSADEYYTAPPITEAAIVFSENLNLEINNIKDEIDTWVGQKEINQEKLKNILEQTVQIQACLQTVNIQERESKIGMAFELLKRFQHNGLTDKQVLLTIAHIFERIQEVNLDLILLGVEKTKEAPGRRHALKTLSVVKEEALLESQQIHLVFREHIENKAPLNNLKNSFQYLSGVMEILGISKVQQYLNFITAKLDTEIPTKTIADVIAITDATLDFLNTNAPFLDDLKIAINKKQQSSKEPSVAKIIQSTKENQVSEENTLQKEEKLKKEMPDISEKNSNGIDKKQDNLEMPLTLVRDNQEKIKDIVEENKTFTTLPRSELSEMQKNCIYQIMEPYWLHILKDGVKFEAGVIQLKNILNLLEIKEEADLLNSYLTERNNSLKSQEILDKYIISCQVKEKTIEKIKLTFANIETNLIDENWEAILVHLNLNVYDK